MRLDSNDSSVRAKHLEVKSRASTVFVCVSIAGLCTLSATAGFVIGRQRSRRAPSVTTSVDEVSVSPESPVKDSAARLLRRLPASIALPSRIESVSNAPNRPATEEAHEVLSGIRAIFDQRSSEQDSLEASVNRMDDYLIGVIAALRSTSPGVFGQMAEEFTDDICSRRHNADRDLMLFSRLVILQSDVGSVRSISCALEGKRREDVLLWSLLRAWNSVGRPDLPDVRAIGGVATDERTKRLLLPPAERAELERAGLQQSAAAARDVATSRIPIGRARFE